MKSKKHKSFAKSLQDISDNYTARAIKAMTTQDPVEYQKLVKEEEIQREKEIKEIGGWLKKLGFED